MFESPWGQRGTTDVLKENIFFLRITFEVFPRILFCVILNEPLAYNFRSDFPGELFFKLTRLYDNKILWLIFLDSFIMFLRCIRVFREETLEPICCIFFFFGRRGRNPDKNILTIIFTAYKKSKYMLSIIKKIIIITNPYSLP